MICIRFDILLSRQPFITDLGLPLGIALCDSEFEVEKMARLITHNCHLLDDATQDICQRQT